MNRIQLGLLFVISSVVWIVANGLLPLLPVYSLQLGADVSFTGSFLAFSFLMLAISTMLTGWLSDRYQRRKAMFIGAGIFHSLALVLMSRAADQWQFAIATSIEWFFFGMGIALLTILAGLFADEAERGKVFGILALTGTLGLLVGGLLLGRIADTWGYPTLFLVLAIFGLLWPLLGIFVKDRQVDRPLTSQRSVPTDKGLWLFLGAFTLAWIGFFVGRLGTSIVMDSEGYSSTAISSTTAVAGAITLPIPVIFGWLSDRMGRLGIIAVGFTFGAVGLALLTFASDLWQFGLVVILITMIGSVFGVGSAHTVDIVPEESIGVGLSLFESASWVAGILGFVAAGYAIENVGFVPSVIIGAALPLIAIVVLVLSFRVTAAGRD
jgi:MFS family permease